VPTRAKRGVIIFVFNIEILKSQVHLYLNMDLSDFGNAKAMYKNLVAGLSKTQEILLFTWNPKPSFALFDPYDPHRFDKEWLAMIDILQRIKVCSDNYGLVAEISDSGKLHCHGFIHIIDKIKWFKSVRPWIAQHGFIKDRVARKIQWKTFRYHSTDIPFTLTMITENPIVFCPETYSILRKLKKKLKFEAIVNYKSDQVLNKNILDMFQSKYK